MKTVAARSRRRPLDQRTTEALPRAVGVHAHLLDVGGPVDNVEQQLADRPVAGVNGDEGAAAVGVRCQVLDRVRVVVGDQVHAE